ncbi:uncharacterized protein LOC141907172 [Tubulanus polymorphus]|uniref:uncharacterized protein LOC141907172 n=1 Tax=Tubulanus polymorphus TaxID=672921 RepID=UPI003DA6C8E7
MATQPQVTMDNPLLSTQAKPSKILQDTIECIREIHEDFQENQIPINDDSQTLQRFCAKLEFLLQSEQKVHTTFLGARKDYWNYFCDCLQNAKGLNDGIKFVKSINELKTSLGRGRAFIRFALMHHRLADTLQHCVMDPRTTSIWFTSKSMWMMKRQWSTLVNALYDLNDVQFDLSPRGYDLDNAWPTFARKTFGASNAWSPPSRTSSMNSLASLQDLTPRKESTSLLPAFEDECDNQLQLDISRGELEISALEEKVQDLTNEKNALSTELKESQLKNQLLNEQNTAQQIGNENEKVSLKVKLESLELRQSDWKTKISELEEKLSQSDCQFQQQNINIQQNEMKWKQKEEQWEQNIHALKSENLEQSLEIKLLNEEISKLQNENAEKSRLFADVEEKLSVSSGKNNELMKRIEELVSDKEAGANVQLNSVSLLRQTSDDLTNTEKQLNSSNQENERLKSEIKDMRERVERSDEEKRSIANESAENRKKSAELESDRKRLKESQEVAENEILRLKNSLAENDREFDVKQREFLVSVDELKLQNHDLNRKLTNRAKNLAEKDDIIEKLKNEVLELCKSLENVESLKAEKESELKHRLKESVALNVEIKSEIEQLRRELQHREDSVEREKDLYNQRLQEMELERREQQDIISNMEIDNQKQHSEMKNLEEKNIQIERESHMLQSRVKLMEEDQKRFAETMQLVCTGDNDETESNSSVKHLQKQVVQVQHKLSTLEASSQEKSVRIQQLNVKIDSLTNENEDVSSKLKALQTVLEALDRNDIKPAAISEFANISETVADKIENIVKDRQLQSSKLRHSDAQNIELKTRLNSIEQDYETIQSELQMSQLENADLKTMVSKLEQAEADLSRKLELRQVLVDEEMDKSVELRNTIKQKDLEIQLLEEKVNDMESTMTGLKDTVDGFTDSNQCLQKDMDRLRAEINEKLEQIEKLRVLMVELETELGGREKRLALMDVTNKRLNNEMKLLQDLVETANESSRRFETQIRSFEDRVTVMSTSFESLQQDNERLLAEKEHINDENVRMRNRIEAIIEEKKSLEQDQDLLEKSLVVAFEEKIEILKSDFERERASYDRLIGDSVCNRCSTRLSREDAVRLDKAESVEKTESTNSEKSTIVEAVITTETLQQGSQESSAQNDSNIHDMNRQLENLIRDKELIGAELETMKTQLRESRDETELLKASGDEYKQRWVEKEEELDIVQDTLTIVEKSKSVAENKLKNCYSYIDELKVECAALRDVQREYEELREDHRELEREVERLAQMNADYIAKIERESSENQVAEESTLPLVIHESENYQSGSVEKSESESKPVEQRRSSDEDSWADAADNGQQANHDETDPCSRCETCAKLREELSLADENLTSAEEEIEQLTATINDDRAKMQYRLEAEKLHHETALKGFAVQGFDLAKMVDQMNDQETLIETLELEMQEIKDERDIEQEKQWQEINELKLESLERENNIKQLNETLKKTTKLYEEEKTTAKKQQNEIVSLTSHFNDLMKKKEDELAMLVNDTVELKKKLIKLMKEKDSLWKKTDKLEYQQRIKAAETWMADLDAECCLGCRAEFSFMVRKHHCRLCGRIFCHNCSNNWILTTHSSKKSRVCNKCFIEREVEKEGNLTNDIDLDEEMSVQIPNLRRETWNSVISNDTSIDNTDIDTSRSSLNPSPPSLGLNIPDSPDIFTDTSDIPYSPVPTNATDEYKTGKLTATNNSDFHSTTDDLTSHAVVTDDDIISGVTTDDGNNGIDDDDDAFHLISEEEIARSLSMSGNNPATSSSSDSIETNGIQTALEITEPTECTVTISPGKMYAVTVLIKDIGTKLCWQFKTEPKSVPFSVTYRSDESTSAQNAQVLVPTCKCNSHKQAVQGELVARQHGIYTLLFNNTSSRFTSNNLTYKLQVKEQNSS